MSSIFFGKVHSDFRHWQGLHVRIRNMEKMRVGHHLVFGILGYKEKKTWVALALELDIRGYGKTFEAAAKEMMALVTTQVSFALFKKQPDMIWKAADPIWFEIYCQVRRESLTLPSKKPSMSPYLAASFSIPPAFVTSKVNQFSPLHASP